MKRTLYVRRKLINSDEVVAWAKGQGFTTCLPPDKMHVTLIYCKTELEWGGKGELKPVLSSFSTIGGERSIELFKDDACVLRFTSTKLQQRWKALIAGGARSDFPTYKPHITISYQANVNISKIKPFEGTLFFGGEIFSEISTNWKESLVEKTKRLSWPIP